ncbi:MAG TPA: periplasmic heavy metal sensor [Polyangia bacterium]|nr:periplasmic heavy metal sensor [Polyangia bacterium]
MGPGFGGGLHWMRGGFGRGYFLRVLSERLEATPAQERVIRDATEEFRDTVSKLRGEGRQTRADVASTFRKGHFDEVLFGEVFARHDRGIEAVRKAFVGMGARIHDALDERQRAELADLIEAGPAGWRPRWGGRGRGWGGARA